MKSTAGFTLIEIVLVLSILSVIMVVSFVSLIGFIRSAQLDAAIDSTLKIAVETRGNAVTGTGFTKWGFTANNNLGSRDEIVFFSCTTDACGPTERTLVRTYTIPALVSLTLPEEEGSETVIFSQNGEVADGKTRYFVLSAGNEHRVLAAHRTGNLELYESGRSEVVLDGGYFLDAAMGKDFLPIFSHAQADGTLLVTKCMVADCSESITNSQVGVVVKATQISVGPDGNPVVMFIASDNHLKLIACDDPQCIPPEQVYDPDPSYLNPSGAAFSAVLDDQGNPVILNRIRFLRCLNKTCTQAVARILPLSTLNTSHDLALVNNLPFIAYSSDDKLLHRYACNDPFCDPAVAGPEGEGAISSGAPASGHVSITNQFDGNPLIMFSGGCGPACQYSPFGNTIAACFSPDCAVANVTGGDYVIWGVNLSEKGTYGLAGSDGLPAFAFVGGSAETGKSTINVVYGKCLSENCFGPSTPGGYAAVNWYDTILSNQGIPRVPIAAALYPNNNPLIAFLDGNFPGKLHIMTCRNPLCK